MKKLFTPTVLILLAILLYSSRFTIIKSIYKYAYKDSLEFKESNYSNKNYEFAYIVTSVNIRNADTDVLRLTEKDTFSRQLGNGAISLFHHAQIMMQQNADIVTENPNSVTGEKAA